jgi:hypothetical protein
LGEAERVVGDADLEMLGHVAPSQHCIDGLADRRSALSGHIPVPQCPLM